MLPLRISILCTSTGKVHRDLNLIDTLLYILILARARNRDPSLNGILGKKVLSLCFCFQQPCSSADCSCAASRSRLDYHRPNGLFQYEQTQTKTKNTTSLWVITEVLEFEYRDLGGCLGFILDPKLTMYLATTKAIRRANTTSLWLRLSPTPSATT